jgi:hypothetical protein
MCTKTGITTKARDETKYDLPRAPIWFILISDLTLACFQFKLDHWTFDFARGCNRKAFSRSKQGALAIWLRGYCLGWLGGDNHFSVHTSLSA